MSDRGTSAGFPGGIAAGDPVAFDVNNLLPGGKIGWCEFDGTTASVAGNIVVIGAGGSVAALSVPCGAAREIDVWVTFNIRAVNQRSGQGVYGVILGDSGALIQRRNFWIPPHYPISTDGSTSGTSFDVGFTFFGRYETGVAGDYDFGFEVGPVLTASGGSSTQKVIVDQDSGAFVHGSCLLQVYDCGPIVT